MLTLVTGTVAAQAISVLAAPLLTRLYAPEDFGIFAVFLSTVALLGVPATLRYYLAIIVPEDDRRAAALVTLSLGCLVAFSIIWLVGLVLARGLTGRGPLLDVWVLLIPSALLLSEALTVLSAWLNRARRYREIAIGRVVQMAGVTLWQVLAGIAGTGLAGLTVGLVAGQLLGFAVVARAALGAGLDIIGVRSSELKEAARAYIRFPLFSLPADLINVAANQIPVVLLAYLFGAGTAGHYLLTVRALGAPVSMIGTAISTVFQERAARDFAQTGSCRLVFVQTFKRLLLISVVPFALIYAIAPDAFTLLFGESWRPAGHYAQILAPLYLMRFVASPLSYVLYIAGKQSQDLAWQVILLTVTIAALSLGGTLGDPASAVMLFSAGYAGMYGAYLVISYRASQQ